MTVRPDFFIVGAPKCGTTALTHYLSQHPEIFMSPVKESHFYATDFRYSGKYPRPSEAQYLAPFAEAGGAKRRGEASVFYLYSRAAVSNFKQSAASASFIIMLRDPLDMVQSYHRQLVFDCDEELQDLQSALGAEGARKCRSDVPSHLAFAEMVYYREVVDFAPQVQRYFDTFGRENVHVILFDDLKANPARVYEDTLRFLDVRPAAPPVFTVVNPHKSLRSRTLGRLLKTRVQHISPRTRRIVRRLMSERARHGAFSWFTRWNTRYERRPPIADDFRESLARELRPGVNRLETILDRDLGSWCIG